MPDPLDIKKINPRQIDLHDEQFRISPTFPLPENTALVKSISQFGLIHPPIVKEQATGYYILVTGRSRYTIWLKTALQRECPCLVVPMQTDDANTFLIVIEAKLQQRHLTPIEIALLFSKLEKTLSIDEIARIFLPRLAIPSYPSHIRRRLTLLDLEDQIQAAIHCGTLDERVAYEFTAMPFTDRLSLFEIITQLGLGIGKQKKLVSACQQLAKRHKITIATMISSTPFQDIIHHPTANQPQKATNLMNFLDRSTTPRLHAAEKDFKKFTASLNLPKNAELVHSPAFEKDTMTLSITFNNQSALLSKWQFIDKALTD